MYTKTSRILLKLAVSSSGYKENGTIVSSGFICKSFFLNERWDNTFFTMVSPMPALSPPTWLYRFLLYLVLCS